MSRAAVLREAEARDRPALLDLWVAAWRLTLPQIDFEARRDWLDRHLDQSLRSGSVALVAELDGDGPVGFMAIDTRRGYLDQLVVAPVHQGSGIADLLMQAAKHLSPAVLDLDVNQDNLRALSFYRRHGFRTIAPGRNSRSGLPTLLLRWRDVEAS